MRGQPEPIGAYRVHFGFLKRQVGGGLRVLVVPNGDSYA